MFPFTPTFQKAYRDSLQQYRHFYDDFDTYGDPETATQAFYFIPGINGTSGQIRWALPSLIRRFGRKLYIRSLYLEPFSADCPIWEKYTTNNVVARRQKIAHDIESLLARFPSLIVIASSNGFYDFASAVSLSNVLQEKSVQSELRLLWIACAPDHFKHSNWVRFFANWNGFRHKNHLWAAVPNANCLAAINPEARLDYEWQFGTHRRHFSKLDLESRFPLGGLWWAWTSPSCFNEHLQSATQTITNPLHVQAHVLVAEKDGYWYGQTKGAVRSILDRYLTTHTVVSKPRSHLWVTTPEHITELLNGIQ